MDNSARVGIVHYGCGNIYNVEKSFKKIGLTDVTIIEEGSLNAYDVLVLPGVGSYKNAMEHIIAKNYHNEIIEHINNGKKILGICLGMQLLMESSEEFKETDGLKILKGKVLNLKEFVVNDCLPHVGLNRVIIENTLNEKFYFDHSYKIVLEENYENILVGSTSYGNHEFISYIQRYNITAVQFHPELSGEVGLKFLSDFFNNEVTK